MSIMRIMSLLCVRRVLPEQNESRGLSFPSSLKSSCGVFFRRRASDSFREQLRPQLIGVGLPDRRFGYRQLRLSSKDASNCIWDLQKGADGESNNSSKVLEGSLSAFLPR